MSDHPEQNETNTAADDVVVDDKPGCGQWYTSEIICQCCTERPTATWFGAVDVVNGKTIDFNASFRLGASRMVLAVKFLLWGFTVGSFAYGWSDYQYPYWFMAYISYWTMFYSCVYMTLSLASSYLVCLPNNEPNFFIKATWVMYPVAVVHGISVVILFWATEYNPDTYNISYFIVVSHGLSLAASLVDGVLINKVPVRLVHYAFCLTFGLLFIGWSIIQGLIPIDNPNKTDGDDESLYSILDWAEDPLQAAIVVVLVMFVAFPIFTLVFWGLSLWGRRYVVEEKDAKSAGAVEGKTITSGGAEEGKDPAGAAIASSESEDVEAPEEMTEAKAY